MRPARVAASDENMWVFETAQLESLKGLAALERVGRLFIRKNIGLTTLVAVKASGLTVPGTAVILQV
jgi:hypothetical protein